MQHYLNLHGQELIFFLGLLSSPLENNIDKATGNACSRMPKAFYTYMGEIKVIIDLDLCFDLMDSGYLNLHYRIETKDIVIN